MERKSYDSIDRQLQDTFEDELATGLGFLAQDAGDVLFDRTRELMGNLVRYKELLMMYVCAMKEIQTKFEVLDTEFNVRYRRNPISSIYSRLKKSTSIVEKLDRQGKEFSVESIAENIRDIAGVRVVCFYIDDIYQIADSLLAQDDIRLIARKDYIANPKPNGYRSLHLVVEVQIRTVAMDFWASLEHQLKYKHEICSQEQIISQLKDCADVIAATDKKMLDIRHQIEAEADCPGEDDILMEKLSRMDIRIV